MFKDLRLIFTSIVVICFIGFGTFFIRSIYQFEHDNLVKSLNESLTKAIEVYRKFSLVQKEMMVLLPDTSVNNSSKTATNLIQNGDFDWGDTLFNSTCEKLDNSIVNFSPNPMGWQWITADPGETRGNWTGKGYNNKGSFLLIDGPTNKNVVVWEQIVHVQPKTNYEFKFQLSSMATNASYQEKMHWSLARINVHINNSSVGIALAPSVVNKWVGYTIFIANDTSNTLHIQLTDENLGGLYNDFGLDHFVLQQYLKPVPANNTRMVSMDVRNGQPSKEPDVKSFNSMVAYELRYMGLDIPFKTEVLHGVEAKNFYKEADVSQFESGKYFERYCIKNHRLYTGLFYLDNGYSVHISVSRYVGYILRKNVWIITFIILLMIFSVVLWWMVIRYTRKEKQIAAFKYELTNSITHELKTPVATIMAAMDALQHHGLLENKEKTAQYIAVTSFQAKKLNSLIENVLTLAMVDDKEIILTRENCDLNNLVLEMLAECNFPDFVKLEHQLHDTPLMVDVNKIHFNNVLHTLVDNAIKYKKANSVSIIIATGVEKGRVFFRITDDGIGIDKKYHKFIFEKYYRVANNDTHQVKGHGLGLSYVKTIADNHNISIALESSLGNGTELTLIFNS